MDETNVRNLSITFGLVLIAVGGQPLVNYFSGDSSLRTAWPGLTTVVVGACLVLWGFFRKPKPDGGNVLIQKLSQWGASPVPYAMAFLLLWVYFETLAVQRNLEIATLRNDQHSITQALDRFVLPRQLSHDQIIAIGEYLQRFPPHTVSFDVVQADDEADSYRSDLSQALERGGWHAKMGNYLVAPPRTGLLIDFEQTQEHYRIQPDPKQPKADVVLLEAFGLAGVAVNGTQGGDNVPEDSLKIVVGHRLRNSYALPCEPK